VLLSFFYHLTSLTFTFAYIYLLSFLRIAHTRSVILFTIDNSFRDSHEILTPFKCYLLVYLLSYDVFDEEEEAEPVTVRRVFRGCNSRQVCRRL